MENKKPKIILTGDRPTGKASCRTLCRLFKKKSGITEFRGI